MLERKGNDSLGRGDAAQLHNPGALRETGRPCLCDLCVSSFEVMRRRKEAASLRRFVAKAVDAVRGSHIGNDWDGGSIQDAMQECGILAPVRVTEPCGKHCSCDEWDAFPQDCLRLTELGERCVASSEAQTPNNPSHA